MNANRYIGIPYADKGRTLQGADCWGLVRLIYLNEFGIELPSYDERYLSSIEAEEISRLIAGEQGSWLKIPLDSEKEGDLIIMRLKGHPMHVGTIIEPGTMIHILEGTDAVCERYTGILWRNRVVNILRHRERA